MFYDLRLDANVTFGGLWFDPETMQAVEVVDLDSAAGVDWSNLIEKGPVWITESRIRAGASTREWDIEERRPGPPVPEGPREWMPQSFYEKWAPPPKPGHLFWMPDIPLVEEIIPSWRRFEVASSELGLKKGFNFLADEDKANVMLAADVVLAEYGFDTKSDDRILVIKKGSERAGDIDALTEGWRAGRGVIATNPKKMIWKILKEWGIKKPDR